MAKRNLYIDDDEVSDEVPPGHSVRVPLLLCDTARFEPRPLSRLSDLSAADLDRHRPGYRLSDGEASKSTNLTDLDAARDAAQAARDRWIADMCSAWKRPPTHDAGEPDEQLLARHLRGKPDDDGAPDPGDVRAVERRRLTNAEAQRERDLAWTRYRDNLANAWKTDPRAATAIQRQGERWRGGR
jgi:hypothetical protein